MSVSDLFETMFGLAPEATSKTPGRVNLIGEHIDYNGGIVLPAPINKYVECAIGESGAGEDEIYSKAFDEMVRVPIDSAPADRWCAYAAAALRFARANKILTSGARLAIDSDIPHGAGLSSSAALIVGVLRAAYGAANIEISDRDLAIAAQRVENKYVGVPCGVMDQFVVAAAAAGTALALDTKDLSNETISLPIKYSFVVVDTGITRRLNDGRYAARRAECEEATRRLGITYLCDLDISQMNLVNKLPPPLDRRARHAVTEHRRVLKAIVALKKADMHRFGAIMVESHQSMQDDFEVSTPEIDAIVKTALEAGAFGARLTGGGFGGCIVACVKSSFATEFSGNIKNAHRNAETLCVLNSR